jgi:transcriptional regulator with XRE-family HTH domain
MYYYLIVRRPLSAEERKHGRRLGARLASERAKSGWSAQEVATAAHLSIDTLRSMETGRVATPAFLTVARLAEVLGLSLDDLHRVARRDTSQSKRRRKLRGGI